MTARQWPRRRRFRWPFTCAVCGAWTTSGPSVNYGHGWECLRCALDHIRERQETQATMTL